MRRAVKAGRPRCGAYVSAVAAGIENSFVAERLEQVASLLEAQAASAFRVRAYQAAARSLRELPRSVSELYAVEGHAGLETLAHVGRSIAAFVEELLTSGRCSLLDRLEGDLGGQALIAALPGMGPTLARRVHDQLGVETLEELELAAHDGRLERVPGIGPRRSRAVRDALASLLGRRRSLQRTGQAAARERPGVALLLGLDAEYRLRTERDEVPRITPRRFNPQQLRWLPIWHVDRDGYHFTLLYSNTARAHELGRTRDWVVISYDHEAHEGQHTVVTELRGPLAGRRVVRGREPECLKHYRV
jgi:DNA polymerase (family 10)